MISILAESDSNYFWSHYRQYTGLLRVNVCKTGAENECFDSLKFRLPQLLYIL